MAMFRRFFKNQRGSIIVQTAILLPILLGFAALAIDDSVWFSNKKNIQTVSDVAAVATAYQITSSSTQQTLLQTATAEASRNGFSATNGNSIQLIYPPSSGTYAGNTSAVEIALSMPQNRYLSVLQLSSDPTATVRSVALRNTGGDACILALDNIISGAISFQGNPSVNLTNCIVAANSNSSSAISIGGSVNLSAESLYTVGGYQVTGGGSNISLTNPATTGAEPLTDPYASLPEPVIGTCPSENSDLKVKNTATLSPGVYCNGLTFNANSNVTLEPGVYIIDRGTFKVNGGATITGTNVTLFFTSSTGSDYSTVDINGSAVLNLSAPTTGNHAGILMHQDSGAPTSGENTLNGNSSNNLTGTLYFPRQTLKYSGGSSSATGCTRVVARVVDFQGNANFANNCENVGGSAITVPGGVELVE